MAPLPNDARRTPRERRPGSLPEPKDGADVPFGAVAGEDGSIAPLGPAVERPAGPPEVQRAPEAQRPRETRETWETRETREARAEQRASEQRAPGQRAAPKAHEPRRPAEPQRTPQPETEAAPPRARRVPRREGAPALAPTAANDTPLFEHNTAGAPVFKGLVLSLFQWRAVEAVMGGKNVLVSAPTGAGKTLVAEFAIADAVRNGRRAIYTAPIKALSNQKFRDFKADGIDVGLMTGDVTIHPTAQVLIMTTEILRNSILEDPSSLADVAYVVFDEVHYMDDLERGTVWEESLIFAPPEIRFICLSATIANLDELGAWIQEIRHADLEIVRSDKRPVPLRQRLFHPELGFFEANRLDWARRKVAADLADKPKRPRRRDRGDFGARREEQRREETRSIHALLDGLQEDSLLPALVFCFSRKDCERLALANQKRELLSAEERRRMEVLQTDLIDAFQLDRAELVGEVFQLARHGIGYHHAGMLPRYKEVVERMFTSGLLKLLFTTETFAVGINMPARTAVFFGLKKFDGVTFDYLRTRDYMQMAGRAGRQGIDTEGIVVARLEPKDLAEAPLERLFQGKPEPVESRFRLSYSAILHLVERLGRERLFEAWDKSFAQFRGREASKKARAKARQEQRKLLEAHLALLLDLGHLEAGDVLTAKGRTARAVYGFELQISELLWRGALENLDALSLAVLFVGLVHEERRRGEPVYIPPRLYGGVRRHVSQLLLRLVSREAEFGIPTPMKLPDWGLTPAVAEWARGAAFEDLERVTDATPGDLVRAFRMAIQLMRQLRRGLDPAWDLADRLDEAILALNREEVDARRQLELG